MGNCLSRSIPNDACSKNLGLSHASQSIFNREFLHLHNDSLGAAASSAHFAVASFAQTYSSTYACSKDMVLIGLVEGVGLPLEASALTAAFVDTHLLQTFQETCQHYGGLDQHKHEEILRSTLQSLHHKCLVSRKLPRSTKAFGASSTVALVNLTTHTCTVANSGHSRCLLASVSGSFNSKRPHCTWASTLHTTQNQKEKIHADRHKNPLLVLVSQRKSNGAAAGQPGVFLTRALGVANSTNNSTYTENGGFKKASNDSSTTTFKNKFDVEVDVNTFQLTPTEGHLIIGSSGFWEVVAPPAVALRAHLFSKVGNGIRTSFQFFPSRHFSLYIFLVFSCLQFQEAQKNVAEIALRDGVPFPSPAERSTHLAEHLLNFALSIAAKRLDASIHTSNSNSTTNFNADDMKNLPFKLDVPVEEGASQDEEAISEYPAGSADGNNTDGGRGKEEEENNKVQQLVRKDVFGDLACVVISFSWPNQGHKPMFQPPPPRLFHPTSQREALSPLQFQSSASSDLAPLARYRWAQLRMVVDYHRLHRREVLQRWQETVGGILKKAQQRAKAVAYQVENDHGIAVNVSPLMKLSAKHGHVLPSSAFNVRASINF